MTSTIASFLHLTAHSFDRSEPRVGGSLEPLWLRLGTRWRRFGGGLADLLGLLRRCDLTPSEQAMSDLSSTERPRY